MTHDTSEKIYKKVWVKIGASVGSAAALIYGTIVVNDRINAPVDAVSERVNKIEQYDSALDQRLTKLDKIDGIAEDTSDIKTALVNLGVKFPTKARFQTQLPVTLQP